MTPVRIVSGGSGNTRSVANEAGKERIGMTDGKSTYYVSVQAGTVNAGKGDAAFEFEIEATPEEIRELENLFAGAREADRRAYFRAHVPFLEYWHRSEEHTSELQSRENLVCRLLLEKKKTRNK